MSKAVENKKVIWDSKTLWVNLVMAVISFFPGVAEKISHEMLLQLALVANMVLRLITKDKVVLK
jgi:hypothetical protein